MRRFSLGLAADCNLLMDNRGCALQITNNEGNICYQMSHLQFSKHQKLLILAKKEGLRQALRSGRSILPQPHSHPERKAQSVVNCSIICYNANNIRTLMLQKNQI